MKKIQITAVPPGKLPLDIRTQFVGISILYDPDIQSSEGSGADTYIVRTRDAIIALREYRQNDAADFLCHAGVEEKYLRFPREICELIED